MSSSLGFILMWFDLLAALRAGLQGKMNHQSESQESSPGPTYSDKQKSSQFCIKDLSVSFI